MNNPLVFAHARAARLTLENLNENIRTSTQINLFHPSSSYKCYYEMKHSIYVQLMSANVGKVRLENLGRNSAVSMSREKGSHEG